MAEVETPNNSRDLTRGSINGHLFNLTVPMMWGIVASLSISLADAYFLGRLGTVPLAAISFTFPVVFTFTTLAIGLGAGATSVVSRAIGQNDRAQVRRLATDAIILSMIIVILFCVVGFLTIDPLFRLLGAEGEVLEHIRSYMRVWYYGMPFLVVPMVANNLIRATGDAVVPSVIMSVSAVVNVALDPLFIFGGYSVPALGVEGAAWASLCARAVAFVFSIAILIWREQLIVFVLPPIAILVASWKRVLSVGIPAAAGNMMNPIGVALVTSFIAGYGADSVAAFGAATRIEAFAAIPMLALSAAIGPIAGQNWGADQIPRIRRTLKLAFGFSIAWALVMGTAAYFGGAWLAHAFTSDAEVAEKITTYLLIVSTSLMGYGVIVVAAACCNAIGHAVRGVLIFGIRMLFLYVPLCWLASLWFDLTAVFWAISLTNMLAGVVAYFVVLRVLDRHESEVAS